MVKHKLMELHRNYVRNGKYCHAARILDLLREKEIKLGYGRTGIEIENDLVNFCGMKYVSDYSLLRKHGQPPLRGWIRKDAILEVVLEES